MRFHRKVNQGYADTDKVKPSGVASGDTNLVVRKMDLLDSLRSTRRALRCTNEQPEEMFTTPGTCGDTNGGSPMNAFDQFLAEWRAKVKKLGEEHINDFVRKTDPSQKLIPISILDNLSNSR